MNFIKYLTEEDFLLINEEQIKRYGGLTFPMGIAKRNEFEYLLDMVEDDYYYPILTYKAALYVQKIITNHIFYDGNKRTAAMVLDIFLKNNGHKIKDKVLPIYISRNPDKTIPSQFDKSNTTGILTSFFTEIATSIHNWQYEDILLFINEHIEPIP